jgi:hypothetical protein
MELPDEMAKKHPKNFKLADTQPEKPKTEEKPKKTIEASENITTEPLIETVVSEQPQDIKPSKKAGKQTCPYCNKENIDGRHLKSCSSRPEED